MISTKEKNFAGQIMIEVRASNSTNKTIKWVENNFPLKRYEKYLVASRIRLNLTMEEIRMVIQSIRQKTFEGTTWGAPGNVQLFIRLY